MLKILAILVLVVLFQKAAFAISPLEAAQNLATTGESDPQSFTLMIVAISLLFVFAFTLIIATSLHVFKKKPSRR
jgi:hypothetical protein